MPSKVATGSNVTTPAASTVQTPSAVVNVLSTPGVDGSRSIVVKSTSLLASLTDNATVTLVSFGVIAVAAVATGVAPATFTVTLGEVETLPSSSITAYAIDALPSKPATGSNVTTPAASTVQTPSAVVIVVSIPGVVGSRSIVVKSTSLFASLMLPANGTETLVSEDVVAMAGVATGGAPETFTVIVAGTDTLPSSSCTVYEIEALPSKLATGLNVTTPVGSTDQTPSGVVSVVSIPGVDGSRSIVVISTSLFASLTLPASGSVTLVSAGVTALLAVATGIAPATVTDIVEGADTRPNESDTVYGTVATPSKPATGANDTTPVASTDHAPSAVVKVLSMPGVEGSRSIVVISRSPFVSLINPASARVALVSAGVVVLAAVATGGTASDR